MRFNKQFSKNSLHATDIEKKRSSRDPRGVPSLTLWYLKTRMKSYWCLFLENTLAAHHKAPVGLCIIMISLRLYMYVSNNPHKKQRYHKLRNSDG